MESMSQKKLMKHINDLFKYAGYMQTTYHEYIPQTKKAVDAIHKISGHNVDGWSEDRRLVGAVQWCLEKHGFEPGVIDGYWGHNTENAMTAFARSRKKNSRIIVRCDEAMSVINGHKWPVDARGALEDFFGPPGKNLVTVPVAYELRLAWNMSQTTNKITCNKKCAEAFQAFFEGVLNHYGNAIHRMNLDLYGGCYSNRKKRGGKTLSTHAYGAAIDMAPWQNRLEWGADKALFARPEYNPMLDIARNCGLYSLGERKNFDWMHFQCVQI